MKKFNFQHPFYQKRCIWRHFQRIFYCLTIENKQCIQKGCAPKFQALKFGMKYSLIGPNQLTKSRWKYIYRTSKLNDKERTELTVCFKSMDVSHNFSKTAAHILNTWLESNHLSQTNLFLNKLSEWMMKSSCCEFLTVYILK